MAKLVYLKTMEEVAPLPCVDKLVFDTKKQAQDMAVSVEWQHGTVLKAYQCQYCHLWHLSSVGR